MSFETYINIIETAFENAETGTSKVTDDVKNIEDRSGLKSKHFFNNILSSQNINFLEIGCFKESTICSTMCGNQSTVIYINVDCIDGCNNYSSLKDDFLINFNNYKGDNNATYIESNTEDYSFNIDTSLFPKINVFMYDADKLEDSHYKTLSYFYNSLDDIFIYIIVNWNTNNGWNTDEYDLLNSISKLNFKILYQKDIISVDENSEITSEKLKIGWWNSFCIFILQK